MVGTNLHSIKYTKSRKQYLKILDNTIWRGWKPEDIFYDTSLGAVITDINLVFYPNMHDLHGVIVHKKVRDTPPFAQRGGQTPF